METTDLVSITYAARALNTQHGRVRTFCQAQGLALTDVPHPKNGRKRHMLPAAVVEEWLDLGPFCCEVDCTERVCRTADGFIRSRCQEHHTRRHAPVGAKRIYSDGYVMVKTAESAGRYGYIWRAEHRMVMEAHLGRPLEPCENVHHINGDRADNRIENLELWFKPQTAGQRVTDLVEYLTTHHRDTLAAALKETA